MAIHRVAVIRTLVVALLVGAGVVATPTAANAATGSIQGTVTAGGAGVLNSYVAAYDAATGVFVAGANTSASGTFAITSLDPGSYRVFAEHPYQSSYASKWFGNSYSFRNAYTTVLAQGTHAGGTDIDLDAGVTVAGTVTAAANGSAIVGVTVQAYDADGHVETGYTDDDGNFSIAGNTLGPIMLRYYAPGYATEWWNDEPLRRMAPAFTAPSGTTTIRDAQLDFESTISGTMTTAWGAPLGGVVIAYDATGSADDTGTLVSAAVIDGGTGAYTLRNLPVGSYKLGFTRHGSGYDQQTGALLTTSAEGYEAQWYIGKPSYATAQTVLVPNPGYSVTQANVYLMNPHFADVTDHTSPFYGSIEWVAATGISAGTAQPTGKPLFKPLDTVSRQAMASFLYKLSGDTFTAPATPTFADVPSSSGLYTAIEWMAAQGISAGTAQPSGKPLFNPSGAVSRSAMAVFLYRYATGLTTGAAPTADDFADVPAAASSAYAIHWMAENEIATGTAQPSGLPLFKPADAVSRQAMALFLYRVAGLS